MAESNHERRVQHLGGGMQQLEEKQLQLSMTGLKRALKLQLLKRQRQRLATIYENSRSPAAGGGEAGGGEAGGGAAGGGAAGGGEADPGTSQL